MSERDKYNPPVNGVDSIVLLMQSLLAKPIRRRDFLTGGLLTATNLFLAACSAKPIQPERVRIETQPGTVLAKEIDQEPSKAELRKILEDLEPSPYRDFVIKYAYPLLADNPPPRITIAGLPIDVFDVRVVRKVSEDENGFIEGTFQGRAPVKTPTYIPEKTSEFPLSLPYLEIGGQTMDGSVTFPQGVAIGSGIEPLIQLLYQPNFPVPKNRIEDYRGVRKFVLLKEAFTMAFYLAYTEAVINEMNAKGQSVYIDYHGRPLDGVNTALGALLNLLGRLTGVLDIGGFILAVKSMGVKTDIPDRAYGHKKTIDIFRNENFTDKGAILPAVVRFIVSHRESFKGMDWYKGKLENRP